MQCGWLTVGAVTRFSLLMQRGWLRPPVRQDPAGDPGATLSPRPVMLRLFSGCASFLDCASWSQLVLSRGGIAVRRRRMQEVLTEKSSSRFPAPGWHLLACVSNDRSSARHVCVVPKLWIMTPGAHWQLPESSRKFKVFAPW